MPKKNDRRSSILKPIKTRKPFCDVPPSPPPEPKRRVSFASSNLIKQFAIDAETNTVWDSTYEETLSKSDHSPNCSNKSPEGNNDDGDNDVLNYTRVEEQDMSLEGSEHMELTLNEEIIEQKRQTIHFFSENIDISTNENKENFEPQVIHEKCQIPHRNQMQQSVYYAEGENMDISSIEQKQSLQYRNIIQTQQQRIVSNQFHPQDLQEYREESQFQCDDEITKSIPAHLRKKVISKRHTQHFENEQIEIENNYQKNLNNDKKRQTIQYNQESQSSNMELTEELPKNFNAIYQNRNKPNANQENENFYQNSAYYQQNQGAPPVQQNRGAPPVQQNRGEPPVQQNRAAPSVQKNRGVPPQGYSFQPHGQQMYQQNQFVQNYNRPPQNRQTMHYQDENCMEMTRVQDHNRQPQRNANYTMYFNQEPNDNLDFAQRLPNQENPIQSYQRLPQNQRNTLHFNQDDADMDFTQRVSPNTIYRAQSEGTQNVRKQQMGPYQPEGTQNAVNRRTQQIGHLGLNYQQGAIAKQDNRATNVAQGKGRQSVYYAQDMDLTQENPDQPRYAQNLGEEMRQRMPILRQTNEQRVQNEMELTRHFNQSIEAEGNTDTLRYLQNNTEKQFRNGQGQYGARRQTICTNEDIEVDQSLSINTKPIKTYQNQDMEITLPNVETEDPKRKTMVFNNYRMYLDEYSSKLNPGVKKEPTDPKKQKSDQRRTIIFQNNNNDMEFTDKIDSNLVQKAQENLQGTKRQTIHYQNENINTDKENTATKNVPNVMDLLSDDPNECSMVITETLPQSFNFGNKEKSQHHDFEGERCQRIVLPGVPNVSAENLLKERLLSLENSSLHNQTGKTTSYDDTQHLINYKVGAKQSEYSRIINDNNTELLPSSNSKTVTEDTQQLINYKLGTKQSEYSKIINDNVNTELLQELNQKSVEDTQHLINFKFGGDLKQPGLIKIIKDNQNVIGTPGKLFDNSGTAVSDFEMTVPVFGKDLLSSTKIMDKTKLNVSECSVNLITPKKFNKSLENLNTPQASDQNDAHIDKKLKSEKEINKELSFDAKGPTTTDVHTIETYSKTEDQNGGNDNFEDIQKEISKSEGAGEQVNILKESIEEMETSEIVPVSNDSKTEKPEENPASGPSNPPPKHENLFELRKSILTVAQPSPKLPEIKINDNTIRPRRSCIVINSSTEESTLDTSDCNIVDNVFEERSIFSLNLTNLKLNETKDGSKRNISDVGQKEAENLEVKEEKVSFTDKQNNSHKNYLDVSVRSPNISGHSISDSSLGITPDVHRVLFTLNDEGPDITSSFAVFNEGWRSSDITTSPKEIKRDQCQKKVSVNKIEIPKAAQETKIPISTKKTETPTPDENPPSHPKIKCSTSNVFKIPIAKEVVVPKVKIPSLEEYKAVLAEQIKKVKKYADFVKEGRDKWPVPEVTEDIIEKLKAEIGYECKSWKAQQKNPNVESNGEEAANVQAPVVVQKVKTFVERIKEKSEFHSIWVLISVTDTQMVFRVFHKVFLFVADIDPSTEIVKNLQITNKLKIEGTEPRLIYIINMFEKKITSEHIQSSLGGPYNVESLLDFVSLLRQQMFVVEEELLTLALARNFRVQPDMSASIKFMSVTLLWIFEVRFNMWELDENIYKKLTVHVKYGNIQESNIKVLAKGKSTGYKFLKEFVDSVRNYIKTKEEEKKRHDNVLAVGH